MHYLYEGTPRCTWLPPASSARPRNCLWRTVASLSRQKSRGAEPLHYAADAQPLEAGRTARHTIEFLLAAGADPNAARQERRWRLASRAVRTRVVGRAWRRCSRAAPTSLAKNAMDRRRLHLAVQDNRTRAEPAPSLLATKAGEDRLRSCSPLAREPRDRDGKGRTVLEACSQGINPESAA
jgi:hypothetical protein